MFRVPPLLGALNAKRAPVRTLTHALTGLTGCACLAAVTVALWAMRQWAFDCAALASLRSKYCVDSGSVSVT